MGAGFENLKESGKNEKLFAKKWKDQESHDRKLRVNLDPDPPDGGYGWIIVFASMMLLLLCHR